MAQQQRRPSQQHRRPSKEDRRRQAREERRLKEIEARKKARRQRLYGAAGAAAAVAAIVGAIALTQGPPVVVDIKIKRAEVAVAREAAGCEDLQQEELGNAPHLDEATAPSADILYTNGRPTHSGLHFGSTAPLRVYEEPVDERATTHNLEHGSVIAWYDPAVATEDDIGAAGSWSQSRAAAGFDSGGAVRLAGAGIIVSPYPDPLDSGKGWAFRAWGAATDCDRIDQTVADAFLIDHWGSHGTSPEGGGGAIYPETVLGYDDTPAPGPTGSPSGPATQPTGSEAVSEPGSDAATETATAAPTRRRRGRATASPSS